jgi:magnesium chelatase subunit D
MRAARASAALNLRDEVEAEDLELAARLVILPRATQVPAAPPQEAPPPEEEPLPPEPEQAEDDVDDTDTLTQPQLGPTPEQILEALEAELPTLLTELPFHHLRRGRSGSRGTTMGKRGRHVRSIAGDPRRDRIDVIGTLRAAAPWQRIRANGHWQGYPDNRKRFHENGSHSDERRLHLQLADVRVKQYRSKAGALFCFAVDASGSMALHRMRQAKGAVQALLEKAYVNRDRVALIAFRGEQAEVVMPPTQSVELAHRALELLPTGGGTPLASALLLGLDVTEQAKRRGILQSVLILLTDGRANIGLVAGGDVRDELQRIGHTIAASTLNVIVVDTQRSYLSRGEARQLAEWLGAEYAYLPNANGEQIADLATGAACVP